MKKAILPILALLPFLFFSCKDKKKLEENTKDVPLMNKTVATDEPAKSQSIIGKWKMVTWNNPTTILSEEDKQKVMDATEIEITSDGKWITRAAGNEKTVSYSYYENTRTMILPGDDGKTESLKLSFDGNRMTLAGENELIVLERI